jgi:hypothetical protein
MAGNTPFALNFLYLVFLLVPGYTSLRGYLSATVQLDTVSRLDKLLLAVVGGGISLLIMLLLNRFGIFAFVFEWFRPLWTDQASVDALGALGYRAERSITASDVSDYTALALLGFVVVQSVLGYFLGYFLGTAVHVKLNDSQRSEEDLQQPWETVVKQAAFGDEVIVVTRNEKEIRGRIYRIGSPSEQYDLLLADAELLRRGADPEPLGMTYHHYRDIAQVQFREMQARRTGKEANRLLKRWDEFGGD